VDKAIDGGGSSMKVAWKRHAYLVMSGGRKFYGSRTGGRLDSLLGFCSGRGFRVLTVLSAALCGSRTLRLVWCCSFAGRTSSYVRGFSGGKCSEC
jgi:hypothetical protein